MQEYASTSPTSPRTIDAQPLAARQTPLYDLLQAFHAQTTSAFPDRAPTSVAQRAVTADSNKKLKRIYDNLLTIGPFAKLDKIVSPPSHPLKLDKSTAIATAAYDPTKHVILVNTQKQSGSQKQSDSSIADCILWEMHNAKSQVAFLNEAADLKAGLTNDPLSADTTINEELYIACHALACEWIEWSKLLEHVSRVEKINAIKPNTIDVNYKNSYTGGDPAQPFKFNTGWFLFENYLNLQIEKNHTAGYDKLATPDNKAWKGYFILQKALLSHSQLFIITEVQFRMFSIGGQQVIDANKNIFTTNFLKELAQKYSNVSPFK